MAKYLFYALRQRNNWFLGQKLNLCVTHHVYATNLVANVHTTQQRYNDGNESVSSLFPTKRLHEKNTIKDSLRKLSLFIQRNNVDDAMQLYQSHNQTKGFLETDEAFLSMLNCLIRANRIDDAKIIVDQFNANETASQATKHSDELLISIFSYIRDHSDLDEFMWFVNKLVLFRKNVDRRVLQIVMRIALDKHHLDVAMELFDHIVHKFRMTPLQRPLTCAAIKANDVDRLEEILVLSTKIHGEKSGIFNMVFAFTECGRIDQAQKLLGSLKLKDVSKNIQDFVEHAILRRQSGHLYNILAVTESKNVPVNREQIYCALIEILASENNDGTALKELCSNMEKESIIPAEGNRDKIVKVLRKRGIQAPKEWMNTEFDTTLELCLRENDLSEANRLLYESLNAENPLPGRVIRYCLSKNAENGNISFFSDLKPKFDDATKDELGFYRFEAQAYYKAKKGEEYIQLIRKNITDNSDEMKQLVASISHHGLDMIGLNEKVYNDFYDLAILFADKKIVKPMCILWTYNFINDKNPEDNAAIWSKYLKHHQTIACSQVANLSFRKKDTDKLRDFLNSSYLNKKFVMKSSLGVAYSCLFDAYFFKHDFDKIIDELPNAMQFISLKDLKPNTLTRLKTGPHDFTQKFWSVFNAKKRK